MPVKAKRENRLLAGSLFYEVEFIPSEIDGVAFIPA